MDIDTKYGLDNDKHLRWNEAKEVELYSLITQHSTWIVVRRPPGEAVITSKWVMKEKSNKLKARLTARGFSQQHGIDYNEMFAIFEFG